MSDSGSQTLLERFNGWYLDHGDRFWRWILVLLIAGVVGWFLFLRYQDNRQIQFVQRVRSQVLQQPFELKTDPIRLQGRVVFWNHPPRLHDRPSRLNEKLASERRLGWSHDEPTSIVFVSDVRMEKVGEYAVTRRQAMRYYFAAWVVEGPPFRPKGLYIIQVDPPPRVEYHPSQAPVNPLAESRDIIEGSLMDWVSHGVGTVRQDRAAHIYHEQFGGASFEEIYWEGKLRSYLASQGFTEFFPPSSASAYATWAKSPLKIKKGSREQTAIRAWGGFKFNQRDVRRLLDENRAVLKDPFSFE